MVLASGQILLDKYKIKRFLDSGAWGDVYLAEDLRFGRLVAIKHLKTDWLGDKAARRRFLQEADILGNFKHPNIVDIYALEQDGDECYIVEEYAEGGAVSDLLEEQGRLPVEQALDIAIAICHALEVIHGEGIIHRDVKPSNILLFESSEGHLTPRLCDFDIAYMLRAQDKRLFTADDDTSGTIHYMSPEQIQSEPVDERSDLYSLGVVLYKMLTGQDVFIGSPGNILQAHVDKKPRAPNLERPEIPTDLNDLILRALSKKPADRYRKARDMRKRMEKIREKLARSKCRKNAKWLL